jgi:hypothetical protein
VSLEGLLRTKQTVRDKDVSDRAILERAIGILKTQGVQSLASNWNAISPTGAHSGVIVAMSDTEVIQHVGQGRHVVWARNQLFGDSFEVDQCVNIGRDGRVQNARPDRTVSL